VTEPGDVRARGAIGRRVVVTGLAGSGKSTLAFALAPKTHLPVIHLDLAFWKPGWVEPSETEWREKQHVVLAGDAWIADGNYHETLDLRIELADTVVVLDMPWWLCSARALRRGQRFGGARSLDRECPRPPGLRYATAVVLPGGFGFSPTSNAKPLHRQLQSTCVNPARRIQSSCGSTSARMSCGSPPGRPIRRLNSS
jgi:hypothetical protein